MSSINSENKNVQTHLRELPSVDMILNHPSILAVRELIPHDDVIEAIRESIEDERSRIIAGIDPGGELDVVRRITEKVFSRVMEKNKLSLQRVINATGILIHTNLGRAILSKEAAEHVVMTATGYTNLEYDLEMGSRGKRNVHLKRYLREITGAEDSLVVNNNAAAVLLVIDTLAADKEVVISRGELVEIGGSFRIPDVIKKGGAILREVGCTNKTHTYDYEENIGENTALLMKCHRSNFSIRGFTEEVPGKELAGIGRKHGITTIEDLGSGLLVDLAPYGLYGEKTVRQAVESGVDIVTFSGDKMLGGPQAGIILGSAELIRRMEKNPLARALRPDKMTIAALEGTLSVYRDPRTIEQKLPFFQMLSRDLDFLEKQTGSVIRVVEEQTGCPGCFSLVKGVSKVGGGALPESEVPTVLLRIDVEGESAGDLFRRLLDFQPPVISRIIEDGIVLDFRTVLQREVNDVIRALAELVKK
jgi:L-seryl-tRNA(Ser) seleniumtransferase